MNKRPGSNKATGRDYSYDKAYEKTAEQRKANASRHRARRLMIKEHGKAAVKGHDVDHVDGNPMNTPKKGNRNLAITTVHYNRAKH
jgi:hypothetical protein